MVMLILLALLLSACDGGSDAVTMTATQKCTVEICTNGECEEVPCSKNP